ncbi:MAG: shikimate kinase [Desulfobacterales bacterium]|nr:shikimate kinase [Desulfobacterales bacterium]
MNIFLIGYRCTGKTSAGRLLAKKLDWPFIDADSELVKENGTTISEMVASHGWDYFREKERDIIKKLAALDRHVIATGGGAVLNNENVKDMKKGGTIVWLKASSETIRQRILQDENTEDQRPALTSKGFADEIEGVLFNRNPIYKSAADFYIDTDSLSIADICSAITEGV